MRARLISLVFLVSCAAPEALRATDETTSPAPPLRPPFAGLREKHLQVEVVDRGRLFERSPGVVAATKKAVEQQLSSHGVIIDDAPSPELRRIVLTLDVPTANGAYGASSCLQVTGRLEAASQAFLPTQQSIETRCGGRSPGAGTTGELIGAFVAAVGSAIAAADGTHDRQLAAALSQAVAEVLSQLDMRTR